MEKKQAPKNNRNFCTTFVLPMVDIIDRNLPEGFEDSYITNSGKVIVTFNKSSDPFKSKELDEFINYQTNNNKHYEDVIINERDNKVSIFYKVPDNHKNNFDCFIQGKYSQFTKEYKTILTRIYGSSTIKDNHEVTAYNTIFPETFKRLQIAKRLGVDVSLITEVLDAPDMSKEIYKDPYTEQILNNIYDNQ